MSALGCSGLAVSPSVRLTSHKIPIPQLLITHTVSDGLAHRETGEISRWAPAS